jgi:hypothetical protein
MSKFYSSYFANQLLQLAKKGFEEDQRFCGNNSEQLAIINYNDQDLELEELQTILQIGGYSKVQTFFESKNMKYNPPKEVTVTSIICGLYANFQAKWRDPGHECFIMQGDNRICGADMDCANVQMDENKILFASLYCDNFTQYYNGDLVIFETLSKVDTPEAIIEKNGNHFLSQIVNNKAGYATYDGMQFPQTDVDINRILDEVNGINIENTDFVFADCNVQAKLQMNHIGAKLEVAMYGGMLAESIPNPPWIINDTFTVHFARYNNMYDAKSQYVLFSSVLVTPEHFKRVEIKFD